MQMAATYGVEAIAIGSLPKNTRAFPFHEQSPAPLEPRVAPGWLPRSTHFFFATDVENEIRHVVCNTPAHRDEEIARAGPGFAVAISGEESIQRKKGVIFFGREIGEAESTGHALALFAHYAYARMMMILRGRPTQPLSYRQLEVLSWAAEGKTDSEIAEILGLSEYTVDKYMRQIKEELGAINRTAAIVAAMRSGLIA